MEFIMDSGYKRSRSDRYREQSKDRLSQNMKKKIRTTMIGAVSAIEDHLGPLIDQEPSLDEVFQRIRADILDKGNHQLRNVDVELSQYDVEWKRHTLTMPVRPFKGDNNE